MDIVTFQQLVVSLGLGLLLGLERERSGPSIAGIRTFPLISLFGTVCAQFGEASAAGLSLPDCSLSLRSSCPRTLFRLRSGNVDPGTTTEIAALLLYVVGALIAIGYLAAALVVAGVLAVLLHSKKPLHNFARAVGERDMRAMMLFVLLSLVILPVSAEQGFWSVFRLESLQALVDGGAHCWHQSRRLHRV